MLHFTDGSISYHRAGQPRSQESVSLDPLEVSRALQPGSYRISSPDDPAYAAARQPDAVSRKTKGQAFTWICEDWDPQAGCRNLRTDDHVKMHWIYLELPDTLQPGKHYLLMLDQLAAGTDTLHISFSASYLHHSEALHVNNVGYSPEAPARFAYLYHWMGSGGGLDLSAWSGRPFYLADSAGRTVFTGTIRFRRSKTSDETGQPNDTPEQNFSGADVYECDFSAWKMPGTYRVMVPGIGSSFPFRLASDAYLEPFHQVMNGIYQQRSGIEIVSPWADQQRPAPHHPGLTPGFAGKLRYSSRRMQDLQEMDHSDADRAGIEAGFKGPIDTWGWYQDAGDWDGYVSHMKVPIELMTLYELAPQQFPDGQLRLPEAWNGLPDLLDEARWLLRYFCRTRAAMQAAGYGSGGVGGARVAGDWFGGDYAPDGVTFGSWQDTLRTWAVLGEDVFTSFCYAGLAAQFAWILQSEGLEDPEQIDWAAESQTAWAWAEAHTQSADFQAPHGLNVYQNRLYAAAALYRLTGDSAYHDQFIEDISEAEAGGGPIYSGSAIEEAWRYPMYLYLLMPGSRPVHRPTLQQLQSINAQSALNVLTAAEQRACRWGGNYYFPMLVGQATTPLISAGVLGFGVARRYAPDLAAQWKRAIYTTADYFLGTNPLNMTWITGVGERSPGEIFCLDSWYLDPAAYPRSGIVPYGPWLANSEPRPLGPWDPDFANKTLAPPVSQWPGHERWWNSRPTPLQAEYTIHQNLINAAVCYGLLAAGPDAQPDWEPYDESYVYKPDPVPVKWPAPALAPQPSPGGAFRILLPESWIGTGLALEVWDQAGRKTAIISFLQITASEQEVTLPLAAGLYYYQLRSGTRISTGKLLIAP
ncbi:MAG: glycoside hydrolase family 9 protein [Bacteroidia bacterium]|nr:glycoside hydrolase family 9 protein [Bacteroidia bacterium]